MMGDLAEELVREWNEKMRRALAQGSGFTFDQEAAGRVALRWAARESEALRRAAPPADGELLVRSDADVRREAMEEAAKFVKHYHSRECVGKHPCGEFLDYIEAGIRARAAALEQDRKEGE